MHLVVKGMNSPNPTNPNKLFVKRVRKGSSTKKKPTVSLNTSQVHRQKKDSVSAVSNSLIVKIKA
jgi:hypothetical protein